MPGVTALSNGKYLHAPCWLRNFLYAEEAARGLDCTEDLAAPGTFERDLGPRPAARMLAAGAQEIGASQTAEAIIGRRS